MKFITNNIPQEHQDYINNIRPIDQNRMNEIVNFMLNEITQKDNSTSIYRKLYKTAYKIPSTQAKEDSLLNYIKYLSSTHPNKIYTENQKTSYQRIFINTKKNDLDIRARLYISPLPENMHELTRELLNTFHKNGDALQMKFHLQAKINDKACDRIVIYPQTGNLKLVEKSIQEVYEKRPDLFYGCEHPLPWNYQTTYNTPGVYFAPEILGKDKSYGQIFAETLIEAKETLFYLYGITNKHKNVLLTETFFEYAEKITSSLLYKNGLLITQDNRHPICHDRNETFYNYDTATLTHRWTDKNNIVYETTFPPTPEARQIYFSNFYNVHKMPNKHGIQTITMTTQEYLERQNERIYSNFK